MEYRVMGRSGLRVSDISLGCWAIGGPSWRDGHAVGWSGSNDEDSLEGLHRAYELGINHLDTADVYGDGHSERLIGRFLKDVPRDRIIVATKVGYFRGTAPNAMQPVHIRHQLEQSLVNLNTEYIDIYYFHNTNFGPDGVYLEEAAELFQQFRKEGKIRSIGQSVGSFGEVQRFCPVTRPDIIQAPYSAFGNQFDNPEASLFRWVEEQNLGLVLFGPLAQGLLLDKYDPENPPQFGPGDIRAGNRGFTREGLLGLKSRLQPLKDRFGADVKDLARVALQFALAQCHNACVIPGFKNARQVELNAQASGRPLSEDDLAFVKKSLRG